MTLPKANGPKWFELDPDEIENIIETKTDFATQLAEKVSQADFNTAITNVGNGSPKGTYATLTALQTAFPTGTTDIYLVTADGGWYYWSGTAWTKGGTYQSSGILDKSITPDKTSFIDVVQSQNLLNPNTVTTGYYLSYNTPTANANYAYSDYIKVPASKVVSIYYGTISVQLQILLYDANKNYLNTVSMSTTGTSYTYNITNADAVYFRANLRVEFYSTTEMIVEGSTLPASYVPYSVTNKLNSGVVVPVANLDSNIITTSSLSTSIDTILEPNYTTNLFNRYDVNNIDGKYLNSNISYDSAAFFISHYMTIPSSKVVTIDYVNTAATPTIFYYDANKKYLGSMVDNVAGRSHTFTFSDANAVYFRINGYTNGDYLKYKDLTMVVEGSALPSFYIEYAKVLNGGIKTLQDQSFKGKRILFMGDSITVPTDEGGWVNWFNKRVIPSSFVDVAVAGAWWENYSDTVLDGNPQSSVSSSNTIPNQVQKVLNNAYPAFDVIIISAGTNNVTSGLTDIVENSFTSNGTYIDISTLDLTKTASAIRWCIEKLQTAYPNAQIFLCTPIQSFEALRSFTNIKAKGDKIKEIASRLAIPYFDNLNCGIYGKYENNGTGGKYLRDGLHPNNAGAKLLGEYVARQFIKYYSF
jgi:lysophospholipase L1-like esterase